jgi:hypothetical protein
MQNIFDEAESVFGKEPTFGRKGKNVSSVYFPAKKNGDWPTIFLENWAARKGFDV